MWPIIYVKRKHWLSFDSMFFIALGEQLCLTSSITTTANSQCGKHNTPTQQKAPKPNTLHHRIILHYLMCYSFSLCNFVFMCLLKRNFCKNSGWLLHFCEGTIGCRFRHGCFITICVVDCQLTSVAWHRLCQLRFASFISGLFSFFGLLMSTWGAGWGVILNKNMQPLWDSSILYQFTITLCHSCHLWPYH